MHPLPAVKTVTRGAPLAAAVAHSVTVAEIDAPTPAQTPAQTPADTAAAGPDGGLAPVVARPRRLRTVAYVSAVAVVIVFTVIALLLKGKTDSGKSVFRPEDQIAMVLLGLLAAAGVLLFTRPAVVADAHTVKVRNLGGWRELSWSVIAAVRFDRGSPWVTLDLIDDDVITVMAVQANDKEHAVRAVRGLRALLAASRAPAS